MEINPSEMNMETANLSPTEWLEKFIIISKEELELSKKSSDDREMDVCIETDDDDDSDSDDDDDDSDSDDEDDDDENDSDDEDDEDDDDSDDDDENDKKLESQSDSRIMIRMGPLFISQPRLKKICKDGKNEFLSTCFTKYTFRSDENDSVDEIHEKANDLKYLLNLCGFNLTRLDVSCYPTSQIMPIITANCLNLEKLFLGFKEIMSQDFENCFSNMSQLKNLTIEWHCENSTLPMTLAKSIEQISGTLKTLGLLCMLKGNDIFSPDSLASVFPRLIALDCLHIRGFGLSQLLLQSIGEMKNVVHLKLHQRNNYPVWDTRVNMYPIGNLKNLESLRIDCNDGVRDEFLINLCNNAKRLKFLYITGTHITDIGMSAINNLEQLEVFNLLLTFLGPGLITNEFITHESIQCLFNPKLRFLDISNCINITDKGVFELLKNLPKLRCLSIENTKLTSGAIKKIWNLPKLRNGELNVFYPTKTANVSI